MRETATSRFAGIALAAFCATAVAAQDIGTDEPADARQPAVRIQLQPAQPPVPQAITPPESYLPSTDELKQVQIDAQLLQCIDRLGDPTWSVREAATAQLLTGSFVRGQMYASLAQLTLSGEQRHRLLTAVHDRLLSTPRGAVGIRVDPRFVPENKIIVLELLPDLPARQVLHIGDRITHLHGQPLVNWDAFVQEVQTRMPGSTISVTVERVISGRRPNRRPIAAQEPAYMTIDVEIELGSAEMLRDPISGQVQRGGDVFRRLQEEANEAAGTFGQQPRQLKLGE